MTLNVILIILIILKTCNISNFFHMISTATDMRYFARSQFFRSFTRNILA